MDEQPITAEAAEAMMAQVNRAIASGKDQAAIELAGSELQLERDADGQITLRAPGQPERMRLFVGSSTRPEGYPADFPFVPDEPVTVGDSRGSNSLVWWSPDDPEALFQALNQQTLAAGWILKNQPWPAASAVPRRVYGKGGLQRIIVRSAGIVTLVQTEERKNA